MYRYMKLKSATFLLCYSSKRSWSGTTESDLQKPSYFANCPADKSFKPVVDGIGCVQQRNGCRRTSADLYVKTTAAAAAAACTKLNFSS